MLEGGQVTCWQAWVYWVTYVSVEGVGHPGGAGAAHVGGRSYRAHLLCARALVRVGCVYELNRPFVHTYIQLACRCPPIRTRVQGG